MAMVRLTGGDLGSQVMAVRCSLADAAGRVEVCYDHDLWETTPYQAADCRHTVIGLEDVGRRLAAAALGMPEDEFDCDAEVVPWSNQIG